MSQLFREFDPRVEFKKFDHNSIETSSNTTEYTVKQKFNLQHIDITCTKIANLDGR